MMFLWKLFGRALTSSELETLSFLSKGYSVLLWHKEYAQNAWRWINRETYVLLDSNALKAKEVTRETIHPDMLTDIRELLKRGLLKKRKLPKHLVGINNYFTGYGQPFERLISAEEGL